MRKVLLLMMIAVMMLSFAAPAFADPSVGSLTITKFKLGRVPTTGAAPTGEEITTGLPDASALLDGVSFTVLRVVPQNPQTGGTGMTYKNVHYVAASGGDAFTATVVTGSGTNPAGVAHFADLPLGIYYVTEAPSALVTDPAAPFFVSIPTIILDGQGDDVSLFDVFAYPKNEDLAVTKEIVSTTPARTPLNNVAIGDVVNYKIVVDVPTDIANAIEFVVNDTYSTGLKPTGSVVAESISVDGLTRTTLAPAIDNPDTNGGVIKINFTAEKAQLVDCSKIEITLSFEVQSNASLNSEIPNDAELTYKNSYGTEVKRQADPPRIHTGGIRIFKHDSVITDLAVVGAKFVLVPKSAANSTFIADAGGMTAGIPNNAFKRGGVALTATSDADGVVEFRGVPYGDYWLYEYEAPEGYRKPGGEPKVITISAASHTNAIPTELDVKVGNVKGFAFPLTGGTGTALFSIAGLAVAALAYGSHRMSKKETDAPC